MVAVDLIPGLDVSIHAAGQALREYEDHDEEPEDRTTTRYVEAVSGQTFEVHIAASNGFKSAAGDGIAIYIHVDGSGAVDSPIVKNEDCVQKGYRYVSRGCRRSGSQVNVFRFGLLETASDARSFKDEMSKVKDLGSVSLEFEMVAIGSIMPGGCPDRLSHVPKLGIVSEKALKGRAISHSVDFTGPTTMLAKTMIIYETTPVPDIPELFATVNFRYRSMETLKSMLIIPRTPTPLPLEERDFETLSREELRELHARVKAAREKEASAVKVKRERSDNNPRPRKVARPTHNSTQLKIDGKGMVRESSTPIVAKEPEVIELD